jgi:23S rRNA (guanosine2251-2'-O)-methyltransferase
MKQNQQLIMGKNCIAEVLRSNPERLEQVFTVKSNIQDVLYKELKEQNVSIKHLNKHELSELVNSTSHQSYIASVKQRRLLSVPDFVEEVQEGRPSLVLMLDSIFDPHNLGAILRTAECFGANCLIYSKNRGTDITPVVSKVSSGASELIPLIRVSNLAETAKIFQEKGYSIIAADVGEGSISLYNFDFPEHTLLILGSEGEGIQKLLLKRSDCLLKIPMQGKIDSLNVAQAASVFLYSYRSQFPD